MSEEQQREVIRDALMAAFADYKEATGGAYNDTGVINTSGYAVIANAMNAQQTRPRGVSKENCSSDIFEHIRLLRAVKSLPSHYQKWLKFRYGEDNSRHLAQDMIELTVSELDFATGRPEKRRRLKQLVTTWVFSRSQFVELLQKDIIQALSINRNAFLKTYSKASRRIDEHLLELDRKALDALYDSLEKNSGSNSYPGKFSITS
ncbi:hypothetical protein BCS71_25715 [Vibrio lentus]|uniref:hypothetical protein n=1 Tax=Vibrio lentus TaxID=136468 RepID=UPI000C856719|nr:hypothetical protein [Vibrio lentus]PMI58289.1 hypothetical protein BCU41_03915 [Vibrio lentus]